MNHNNANKIYLNTGTSFRFRDQVCFTWRFERDVGEEMLGQTEATLEQLINGSDSCSFLSIRNQSTRESTKAQLDGTRETAHTNQR